MCIRDSPAAMPDQPVMRGTPILARDGALQLLFGIQHVIGLRQTQPVADAENVRIHRDGGDVEGVGQHHVGRFAPHARQAGQRVHIGGHLAVVFFGDDLAGGHDVGGLGLKAAGLYIRV